jgi:hypothetical protein
MTTTMFLVVLRVLLVLGNYIVAMRGGKLLGSPNLDGDLKNPVTTAFYRLFEHLARAAVLPQWRPRLSRATESPLLTLSFFLGNIPNTEVYLRTLLTDLLRLFRKDLKVPHSCSGEECDGFALATPHNEPGSFGGVCESPPGVPS